MPPQSNATLRTVTARGSTDPFRTSGDADQLLFEGGVSAWYEIKRRRVSGIGDSGAAVSDVFVERVLTIDPMGHEFEAGQVIGFEFQGSLLTGIVQAVEPSAHPHVPDYMNTTRITLEIT